MTNRTLLQAIAAVNQTDQLPTTPDVPDAWRLRLALGRLGAALMPMGGALEAVRRKLMAEFFPNGEPFNGPAMVKVNARWEELLDDVVDVDVPVRVNLEALARTGAPAGVIAALLPFEEQG